ncbi:conserved exported hypothetical protein [Microbacterium sp. 8M]|nr:conserved exported hypothetical protein [Microbacterium sp. 8M]
MTTRFLCCAAAVLVMTGLVACAPTTAGSPPSSTATAPSATPNSTSTHTVITPPASAAPAEDPSSPPTWIITAAGVGPVRLGDKVSAVQDLSGWSVQDSCRWAGFWADSELQLAVAGDATETDPGIAEITVLGSTTGPRPHTDTGISVGSTEDQVRAAYPGAAEGSGVYGPWLRAGAPAQGAIFFTLYEDSRTVRQVTVTTREKPSSEFCG